MSEYLPELVRVVAYGGIGAFVGFLVGLWAGDRHRVIEEVLHEVERDEVTKHKLISGDRLQTVIVIGFMVLMLLTGLVWLQTDQENAEQDKRECLRTAETTEVLRERTDNYLESATSEQTLWRDLRSQLVGMGSPPNSPLIDSIDRHLKDQRTYLDHLRSNPVPRGTARDC